jgi:transposase
VGTDARAKKAAQLHGIGAVTFSEIVAGVGEFSQFRNARQSSATLRHGGKKTHSSNGEKVYLLETPALLRHAPVAANRRY